jgi:hypothetical protein
MRCNAAKFVYFWWWQSSWQPKSESCVVSSRLVLVSTSELLIGLSCSHSVSLLPTRKISCLPIMSYYYSTVEATTNACWFFSACNCSPRRRCSVQCVGEKESSERRLLWRWGPSELLLGAAALKTSSTRLYCRHDLGLQILDSDWTIIMR